MPACRGERALRGERDPKERLKKKSEKAEKGNSSSFISSFLLLGALIGRGGWCGPQPVLCTRGRAHCGGLRVVAGQAQTGQDSAVEWGIGSGRVYDCVHFN